MSSNMQRWCAGILMLGVVSGVAQHAKAARFGELHITRDTTLRDDQYGSVIFDADNVTLDCANKMVHISSYTKPNCWASSGPVRDKCAIVAEGRSNVTVKNCRIVGTFNYGLYFHNTNFSTVQNVSSNAHVGFAFARNSNISVYDISSTPGWHGVMVYQDRWGWYESIAVTSSPGYGINVGHSYYTHLERPYAAFNTIIGLYSHSNTGLVLAELLAEANGRGVASRSDTGLLLGDSTSRDNEEDGLYVEDTHGSLFSRNAVDSNGAACQTYQDSVSTGNSWEGNSLQSWCGTVPNAH